MMKKRAWLWHGLVLLVLAVLLAWALRNAPLAAILNTIQRLRPWQIGILAVVNAGLYILISLRWWIIVRAEAKKVPYWPLLGVRVAVFGVSYFTLGPQIGGEPLQVLALQRSYGLSFSRATASVLMDKLLEFLVNFLLLALGLAAVTQAGLLEEQSMRVTTSLALVGVLVAWPPVHITLMYRRIYPISAILRALRFIPRQNRVVRFLRAAEWLAGTFCQRHPRALFASLGVSLLAGAGMLLDYGLMLAFLGIDLPFWKTVAGWTAGWLSFLAPLPGGLGALEASQVFALGAFGIPAAAAISLTLLMRARDLLIGGLGLTISFFNRGSIIK
ncbi:MAG TPA: lysylphosphatidylglycerol synthase transmembrane domain-containing protein [Anaerolineales bacterium]|jgi:hypothetical protein